jgi:hypothetical protein
MKIELTPDEIARIVRALEHRYADLKTTQDDPADWRLAQRLKASILVSSAHP